MQKTDYLIVILLAFLIIYPTIAYSLPNQKPIEGNIEIYPISRLKNTKTIKTDGILMRQNVGFSSKLSVTLRRKTPFGYVTLREGEGTYLFNIIKLPNYIYGINFIIFHKILLNSIFFSIIIFFSLKIYRKRGEITWK